MGMYLNSEKPFNNYSRTVKGRYFVDKSAILSELIPLLWEDECYYCFTRPRRFGKSVMANMVAAYFEKGVNDHGIFDNLTVAQDETYKEHLHQHNVIYIDFSLLPDNCMDYQRYIQEIIDGLKEDLLKTYKTLNLRKEKSLWMVLSEVSAETGDKFIFVMDEWDAIFQTDFVDEKDKKQFLTFLKNLLKGQDYVEFAYMTGVMPIAKRSSGSELNMFSEFDMSVTVDFSDYFGFTEQEVDMLYDRYLHNTKNPTIDRADLADWYNGYHSAAGERLYNPRAIVQALTRNQIKSYWTRSGPYDEIFYYIRNNVKDIKDDLVVMLSGEGIEADVKDYAATSMELNTKNEIYSAMVVYGLLTFDDTTGLVHIPNRELMEEFTQVVMTKAELGYVHRLALESKKMVVATLKGDTTTMVDILKYIHDTESPIFSYNSEIELSQVVSIAYLAARDKYRVEREDKAGEGFVDFIFYPERRTNTAIILELKVDATPEEAIEQIKSKNYALRLQGKLGEKAKFAGKTLAVGISYNRKTKEHYCKVAEL